MRLYVLKRQTKICVYCNFEFFLHAFFFVSVIIIIVVTVQNLFIYLAEHLAC